METSWAAAPTQHSKKSRGELGGLSNHCSPLCFGAWSETATNMDQGHSGYIEQTYHLQDFLSFLTTFDGFFWAIFVNCTFSINIFDFNK